MPPKMKYTKEQILSAALKILRESGESALTARAVSAELGCSVCPVFSYFNNMEDLQEQVLKRANEIYSNYVAEGLNTSPAFKGVGISYIKFAMNEPNLFRALFMSTKSQFSADTVLTQIEGNYTAILDSVRQSYGFNEQDSKRLYLHMWIYTHGIAVLCVTKTCKFTPQEISEMLTEVCKSLVKEIKAKNDKA